MGQAAAALQGTPGQVLRPARALLGWLPHDQAILLQNGQRQGPVPPEYARNAEAARAAVAARREGLDQAGVVAELNGELAEHLAALRVSPAAAFFNEGWRAVLVDLRRVCALQPTVHIDHAEERTAQAMVGDLRSLAHITLPLPADTELPAQFDQAKLTWIIRCPNLNLRIAGSWCGPVQPGVFAFALTVALSPSYMQVAQVRGRFVLRDGYHRACGLLRRGITHAPAFLRDFGPYEDPALPPGLFGPNVYLGERPPVLSDYMDNSVSSKVLVPATQKMILVHGIELTPMS